MIIFLCSVCVSVVFVIVLIFATLLIVIYLSLIPYVRNYIVKLPFQFSANVVVRILLSSHPLLPLSVLDERAGKRQDLRARPRALQQFALNMHVKRKS